jgi:redox-sensitive bicupin YhaK (pirin superfamily)
VIHNENPLPGTTAHALQLWVTLPASEKMAAPRYQDLQRGRPSHATGAGCRDSRSSGGVSSPTLNHVPVTAIDARVDDGATFEHELEAGANAFLLESPLKATLPASPTTGSRPDGCADLRGTAFTTVINAGFSPRGNAPSDQLAPDGRLPGMAAPTLDIQGEAR